MSEILRQFGAVWSRLGVNQKVTMFLMLVGLVAGLVALVTFSGRQSYELLYSDLDAQDMSKVVDYLRENNIPYTLSGGGTSVSVAEGSVYEINAALAGKGITPTSGQPGWELMMNSGFGASPAKERLFANVALQGELARVIACFEQVQSARVQIANAEESAFLTESKPAKASVFVTVKPGQSLHGGQVAGIVRFVVGAVPGLEADYVDVIDQRGNLLTSPGRGSGAALAGTRKEYQAQIEMAYARKVQKLLDAKVGRGNAVVSVTCEVDMRAEQKTEKTYEPDKAWSVREEFRTKSTTGAANGADTSEETSTTETVAPEIVTVSEKTPGAITLLNVAVLIDDARVDKEGEAKPYTEQEKSVIRNLVSSAVGAKDTRGDVVQCEFLPFDRDRAEGEAASETAQAVNQDALLEMARHGSPLAAVALFVVFAIFMLRKLNKQGGEVRSDGDAAVYAAMSGSHGEGGGAGMQNNLRHRVKEIISQDPMTAARLLQGWLEEEK
jgi:flagellar M-ring protein FliF